MKKRGIREEADFTSELKALIPDTKESDELLRDATAWLGFMADEGMQISNTKIFVKIVPDSKPKRFLAIFYTIDNGTVALHSIKSFSM